MPKKRVSASIVKKRLILCFGVFLLLTVLLTGRLAWIQLVKGEEYRKLAWEQWNRSIPARSPRGYIYDSQQRILAGSATAETIVAFPPQINDPEFTAEKLAPILDMDYERLVDLVSSNRASIYIRRQVDEDVAREVRELGLRGIGFTPESKRFYPNEKLLSQVLGFVGVDQGWSGLEIAYEDILKGRDGRIVFQSDGRGVRIPQGVQRFIPPKDGQHLVLSIDEYLQFIMERELDRAMLEYDPLRALALAVNPQTGEILAMASKPDFDPNHYAEYSKETWQIAPISNTIEPGSTFKLVTLATSIEHDVYSMDEGFFCSGSLKVGGHTIRCWTASRGGHGAIDFLEVVLGSCNPGFMTLGARLGPDTLLEYVKAFGFGELTGIDLPGESRGIIFNKDNFGPVELATTSFGQGVSVTPLQQIMAVAAMINGGDLMEPYVVKEIQDSDGNVVEAREPTVVRSVISQGTSELVKHIMEQNVLEGSGKNAALPGYRTGGKTGTAQKVGPGGGYLSGEYIVSYLGFFPMENPEVLMYVAVDGAKRGAQWGSQISAPIFGRIATDYVNYLGFPPDGEIEEDVPTELVRVPDLTGLSLNDAGERVDSEGLIIRPLGEGTSIVKQTPAAGARVAIQTEVLVYFEQNGDEEVLVPDLTGRTMREAAEILSWLGLKMTSYGSGLAVEQEPVPYEVVPVGSEVTLEFKTRN